MALDDLPSQFGPVWTRSNSCDQDQFVGVYRRGPAEIAVPCLNCEATQLKEVVQLPVIGLAKGHLASMFSEDLAVGPDFGVAPEIMTDLV
jgi:hypothetical protein